MNLLLHFSRLRQFRSEQFAAGDKGAAGCAMGTIASLEQEDDPGRNYLLNVLCFISLRALLASDGGGS
jgi:hypothetical protein